MRTMFIYRHSAHYFYEVFCTCKEIQINIVDCRIIRLYYCIIKLFLNDWMGKTLNQNIDIVNKEKKFSLFKILIIIIVLIIFFILGYSYYKGYIQKINIANNITGSQKDGDGVTIEDSAFGKIIDSGSDVGITADSNYVQMARNAIMNAMLVAPSVFKVPEDEINKDEINSYLPDNCMVLKYEKSGTDDSLVLISSTNKEYIQKIGDNVDFFSYQISPNTTVILTETGNYKILDGFSGLDLRATLKPGSRLVFSCISPSCDDSIVSWILVLSGDLNL